MILSFRIELMDLPKACPLMISWWHSIHVFNNSRPEFIADIGGPVQLMKYGHCQGFLLTVHVNALGVAN